MSRENSRPKSTCHFSDLNYDILRIIFNFLPIFNEVTSADEIKRRYFSLTCLLPKISSRNSFIKAIQFDAANFQNLSEELRFFLPLSTDLFRLYLKTCQYCEKTPPNGWFLSPGNIVNENTIQVDPKTIIIDSIREFYIKPLIEIETLKKTFGLSLLDATPVSIEKLRLVLLRLFIVNRNEIIEQLHKLSLIDYDLLITRHQIIDKISSKKIMALAIIVSGLINVGFLIYFLLSFSKPKFFKPDAVAFGSSCNVTYNGMCPSVSACNIIFPCSFENNPAAFFVNASAVAIAAFSRNISLLLQLCSLTSCATRCDGAFPGNHFLMPTSNSYFKAFCNIDSDEPDSWLYQHPLASFITLVAAALAVALVAVATYYKKIKYEYRVIAELSFLNLAKKIFSSVDGGNQNADQSVTQMSLADSNSPKKNSRKTLQNLWENHRSEDDDNNMSLGLLHGMRRNNLNYGS